VEVLANFSVLKGMANFRHPAVIYHSALNKPDAVPVGVALAAFVSELSIPLCAGWISCKSIRVSSVVERVQDDFNSIADSVLKSLRSSLMMIPIGFVIVRIDCKKQIILIVEELELPSVRWPLGFRWVLSV
jgi:hypothetical protein